MTSQNRMISSVLEWLNDWIAEDPPKLLDETDLQTWMEEEMLEAVKFFLEYAFRKNTTRADALEILRAVLWETFLFQRDAAISNIAPSESSVSRLLSLPQTAQKSAAWHAEARDLLTGHEFSGAVFGTPRAKEALVAKKCAAEMVFSPTDSADQCLESRTVYCSPLNPFQWGWRFEPVIRTLFEKLVAGGRVDDSLGRIRHSTLPRLAASPDGLICDGPLAGRLVEIKAPVSRVLTRQVPTEYFCQMQLQAEVADVEAVEYIEVRFATLSLSGENSADFLLPSDPHMHIPDYMGCVLVLAPYEEAPSDTWQYAYSEVWPLGVDGLSAAQNWIPDSAQNSVILERCIWRIHDWWNTTVPRNRIWWETVGKPAYEQFWRDVEEARADGRHKARLLIVDSDSECDFNDDEEACDEPEESCEESEDACEESEEACEESEEACEEPEEE
jgi:hypothetical protein